jgi:uncharacterized membrane protein YphA (DoxX/SURF4 family)/thiol-disulfide isomerase/thioredoxin
LPKFGGMSWLGLVLKILVGAFFILSGIFKLYPIEPFELSLVETQIIPWHFAPYIARLLIAFELLLGILLIIPLKRFSKSIYWSIYLTLFFSVYLVILWWSKGNDINCGCMGDTLQMTPSESLLKNAFLVILLLLSRKAKSWTYYKLWIPIILIAASIALPFILNPVALSPHFPDENDYPYPLETQLFPKHVTSDLNFDPKVDTALIGFFSTSCSHCKVAAHRIALAQKKYHLPPIHLFMIGPLNEIDEFNKEATQVFPHTFYGDQSFFKFNNGIIPTLIYIENGEVHKRWQGYDIDLNTFKWIDNRISAVH